MPINKNLKNHLKSEMALSRIKRGFVKSNDKASDFENLTSNMSSMEKEAFMKNIKNKIDKLRGNNNG